jgi:hypothetical protein
VLSEPVGSVDVAATILSMAGMKELPHNGRDLTRPLKRAFVFGMRRTFEKPQKEYRTDGTIHRLEEHHFFVANENQVYVGNQNRVCLHDTWKTVEDARVVRPIKALFLTLEEQVKGLRIEEVTDKRMKKALKALGYEK